MNRSIIIKASRQFNQVTRTVAAAFLVLPLLAGCGATDPPPINAEALSAVAESQSSTASTAKTEQAEMAAQVKSRAAARTAAAAKATEEQAAKAADAAAQAKAAAAAPAPAADFMGWVNATMARYGVSPGPGASFVVGNTGFCGGYMCTTTQRYGTTPFQSLTTVSPGAIGNEFALIHEIAHQHGVGFKDSGGECAADVWARQYVQGSIYC